MEPDANPAAAGAETPPPAGKPRPRRLALRMSLWTVALVLLVLAVVPYFAKARVTECKNSCVNLLRQIEGAKEQWALEARKNPGDPPDEAAIARYLKGGEIPTCPLDKRPYQVGNVGELPRCSVPGHSLQ